MGGKLYSHVRLKIQKQVQVHTSCQRISNRPERLVCNLQYARTASNKILLRRESGILVSLWTGSLIGERVEKSLFLPAFHPFFKQRLPPASLTGGKAPSALSGWGEEKEDTSVYGPNKPFLFRGSCILLVFLKQWLKTSTRPCHLYLGD